MTTNKTYVLIKQKKKKKYCISINKYASIKFTADRSLKCALIRKIVQVLSSIFDNLSA